MTLNENENKIRASVMWLIIEYVHRVFREASFRSIASQSPKIEIFPYETTNYRYIAEHYIGKGLQFDSPMDVFAALSAKPIWIVDTFEKMQEAIEYLRIHCTYLNLQMFQLGGFELGGIDKSTHVLLTIKSAKPPKEFSDISNEGYCLQLLWRKQLNPVENSSYTCLDMVINIGQKHPEMIAITGAYLDNEEVKSSAIARLNINGDGIFQRQYRSATIPSAIKDFPSERISRV
jgi:hypothetical protein